MLCGKGSDYRQVSLVPPSRRLFHSVPVQLTALESASCFHSHHHRTFVHALFLVSRDKVLVQLHHGRNTYLWVVWLLLVTLDFWSNLSLYLQEFEIQ